MDSLPQPGEGKTRKSMLAPTFINLPNFPIRPSSAGPVGTGRTSGLASSTPFLPSAIVGKGNNNNTSNTSQNLGSMNLASTASSSPTSFSNNVGGNKSLRRGSLMSPGVKVADSTSR